MLWISVAAPDVLRLFFHVKAQIVEIESCEFRHVRAFLDRVGMRARLEDL
jgi:hypothetical protein